jgi:hypothetical protein
MLRKDMGEAARKASTMLLKAMKKDPGLPAFSRALASWTHTCAGNEMSTRCSHVERREEERRYETVYLHVSRFTFEHHHNAHCHMHCK